jgi:hypothetical protein
MDEQLLDLLERAAEFATTWVDATEVEAIIYALAAGRNGWVVERELEAALRWAGAIVFQYNALQLVYEHQIQMRMTPEGTAQFRAPTASRRPS